MRNTFVIPCILLLCICTLQSKAQLLNWGTSFSPAWASGNTSGTAPNVSPGLNVGVNITISGGAFAASGGNNTPTVAGTNVVVAGSTNRLNLTPNFSTNTQNVTTVITFSMATGGINFRIADIDKQNPNSNSFYDRVTITGSDGTNTYQPTITKFDPTTDPNFIIISGNVAHANTTNGQGGKTNSNASDQRGTIDVNFGPTLLTSITIIFDNQAGAQANPTDQTIGIGNLSYINSTLPVNLTSFSGFQQMNNVVLKWTTTQEINTEKFELQRSTGLGWNPIATIAATGNSNTKTDYNHTDINAPKSVILYRLKLVDINGNYEYSPIIRIDNKSGQASLFCYPNPFGGSFSVSVYSQADQPTTTVITDLGGRKVYSLNRQLFRGNNTFNITGMDQLLPGIYFASILDEVGNSLGQYRLLKK